MSNIRHDLIWKEVNKTWCLSSQQQIMVSVIITTEHMVFIEITTKKPSNQIIPHLVHVTKYFYMLIWLRLKYDFHWSTRFPCFILNLIIFENIPIQNPDVKNRNSSLWCPNSESRGIPVFGHASTTFTVVHMVQLSGRRGRMVVGFMTTYAIGVYQH